MSEAFRTLIDTFGKGWERGDLEAVASVFTDEAVFLETPFSQPDRGIAAVDRLSHLAHVVVEAEVVPLE